MFGRRRRFITHLGSLLHQEIWPAQIVSLFPTLYVLPSAPGWQAFFITTCGRRLSSTCLVEEDPYEGSGPDSHNFRPKAFGAKSVESDRLHMGIAFLNLQSFKLQRRLVPRLSPPLIYSFPDEVKAWLVPLWLSIFCVAAFGSSCASLPWMGRSLLVGMLAPCIHGSLALTLLGAVLSALAKKWPCVWTVTGLMGQTSSAGCPWRWTRVGCRG